MDPRLRGDDDKNGAVHGQKALGVRLGVVEKLGISKVTDLLTWRNRGHGAGEAALGLQAPPRNEVSGRNV